MAAVPVTDPQRRRHGVADRAAVPTRGASSHHHTVGEPGRSSRRPPGQPDLPTPAPSGQRDRRVGGAPPLRARPGRPADEAVCRRGRLVAVPTGARAGSCSSSCWCARRDAADGSTPSSSTNVGQFPVDLERVGLAAAVEGAHQQDGQALPLGEPADQDLQLDDDVAGATQPQQGLGPLFPGRQPRAPPAGPTSLRRPGGPARGWGSTGPRQSQSVVQEPRP